MIKRAYTITTVTKIPIKIHITLIILLIFIAFNSGISGVAFAIVIFASVVLHELGHSWVAIKKGCRVSEIMLIPFGGMAKMDYIPSNPKDEFAIAIAGPLTSLILSLAAFFLFFIGIKSWFILNIATANACLCLFNLIPAFPMDGGRIFRAFMTSRIGRIRATELAAKIGKRIAIAFAIIGFFWQPTLILIAIFIYFSANTEYRSVYMEQQSNDWFSPKNEQQANVHVSPPPYAQKGMSFLNDLKNKTEDFFKKR